MIKKVFAILFSIFILFLSAKETNAVYDPRQVKNNIFGAHIINHSDLEDLSNATNVNGGDWGYVTIVITEAQRDKNVWQKFMDDCRRLRLIPIVRVATKYTDDSWETPREDEINNWINFFNSLNWVIENRYVVIGNEPNHAKEWGGKIDPAAYSIYLKKFSQSLKNSNSDYFVLPAGFDQDAPNSKKTMDQKKYMELMIKEMPDVFEFVDGWNSHSYPNPAFSGPTTGKGRRSIRGYEWELEQLKVLGIKKDLPIFITETGWVRSKKYNEQDVAQNLKKAYEEVWMKDDNVVAVTPFILNYTEEPFYEFSWKNKNGSYFPIYQTIQSVQKIKGEPIQKINGEIIFSFLNPLMLKGLDHKGFAVVKNKGQAIWTQSESNVINETQNSEIKVSNTKFSPIEPFSTGLVVYTLTTPDKSGSFDIKLGFYVKGERVGDITNSKIIILP
ncbi:MAG: hypothetical protein WA152_00145 [Microgenomates group bacterium]